MPSKSGNESMMSLRRSPRAPARVKVKFGESPQEKRGRKRRRENSKEPDMAVPSASSATNSPSVNMPSTSTQARKKSHGNKKVDKFCWMCHNEGEDQYCSVCPRVYHFQCLNPKNRFTEEGLCPECRRQSVDGTNLSSDLKRRLPDVLPRLLDRLKVPDPIFKTWTATDVQNRMIARVMDLSILQDRLANRDMHYKSTAAFFADLKWIQHNCYIVFGAHSQQMIKVRTLITECKNELIHLEACVSCYVRSLDPETDNLSVLCVPPHPLVWAKMKGFPYWPAKVLKVTNSFANLRFFGTHDKGKVAISQCYFISMKYPHGKAPSKASFQKALEEKSLYVANILDNFCKFQYSEVREKFNPAYDQFHPHSSKRPLPQECNSPKAKRGRKSKATRDSEVNNSTTIDEHEVVDISMDNDESHNEQSSEASETDIQIIESQQESSKKNNFMNHLNLGKFKSNNSLGAASNVQSRTYKRSSIEHLPSTSSRVQNLELQFYEGEKENSELLLNPGKLLSDPPGTIEDIHVPSGEIVEGVVSNMMTAVDSSQGYNFQTATQAGPSSAGDILVPFETSDSNPADQMNHNYQRHISDYPHTAAVDDEDSIPSENGFPNPPTQMFIHKMIPHLHRAFRETYKEYIVPHVDCQKMEVELREEVEKQKRRGDEVKENTDLIIGNMKNCLEIEKQRAVDEARRMWEIEMDTKMQEMDAKLQEMNTKMQEAVQVAINETKESLEKEHQNELVRRCTKYQTSLKELEVHIKAECEKEKEDAVMKSVTSAIAAAKKTWNKMNEAVIIDVKRKQWCAFCLNEACFFCCWNTSYCNNMCQEKHWPAHNKVCDNCARPKSASHVSDDTATSLPETEMVYHSSKNNNNNSNGQPLPTLRLNGQAPRFYVSGANNFNPSPSITISPVITVAQRSQVIKSTKRSSTSQMPPKKAYLSSPHPPQNASILEEQVKAEDEKKLPVQP